MTAARRGVTLSVLRTALDDLGRSVTEEEVARPQTLRASAPPRVQERAHRKIERRIGRRAAARLHEASAQLGSSFEGVREVLCSPESVDDVPQLVRMLERAGRRSATD